MKRIVLTALVMGIGTPLQAKTDYVYGPAPDWERYKALGEAAIRSKLPDPANWAIEWPNGYAQLVWFHKGRFPGYVTCGVLRSLVPVKDRNQIVNFAVSIDHDQVKIADISQRPSNSLVNIICQDLAQRGKIPPARLMDAPPDAIAGATGLTIRVMPEGAYVVAATAGGSGQRAGLTSGMVITRANGIALGGLGMSMATILGSDVASLTLETAAGEHFIVTRAP